MFSATVIKALTDAAAANGIRTPALLALVEVETAGVTFEQDGRTPQLLYERHVAFREAKKKSSKLCAAFAAAGLAIPHWSRSTQYKDEGSSAKRLALIGRARGIDEEVANRSASWGLGQTMGFLAEELGFRNACEMVDSMTGNLAGQIECMIRELKNKHLIAPLNAGNYPTVARIYNGAGYAANHYDTRLADADKRWTRKLAGGAAVMVAAPEGLSRDEWKAVQKKLRKLGYYMIGRIDGLPGVNTVGALSAFQAHEGLPHTGAYDEATRAALQIAVPIQPSRERASATADDLAAGGSKTVATARAGGLIGKAKMLAGSTFLAGGSAEHLGLLDTAQAGVDQANQAKGIWQSFCDLAAPLFGHPMAIVAGVVLIVSGLAVSLLFSRIIGHRLADHISGVHAGPDHGDEE